MKSQAIYLGSKVIDREEELDAQTGEVVRNEFKGVQHNFYCSDWDGEKLESLGKTRTQIVSEKNKNNEEFKCLEGLKVGDKVTVQISETFSNQNQYLCKTMKKGW